MKNNLNLPKIPTSEITPKQVYLTRREFIRSAGLLAGSIALAACTTPAEEESEELAPHVETHNFTSDLKDELGNPVTTYKDVTSYNNFYEFSTDKQQVAQLAGYFKTQPWTIEVVGMVNKPKQYGFDELVSQFKPEERVYRLRCVEAWSMVIPWMGFSLAKLLKDVEPTSNAKYVRFETVMRPDEMPGQKEPWYPWPYQEGLRLDEAMHDLTILATGLYGDELPAQNGGGVRVVVPWKYGFKSIKSISKIELTDQQPATLWSSIAPDEYGFYANVNPNVDHPRWSQASERRIGELSRTETLMFNGYADLVANLYTGMDLKANY